MKTVIHPVNLESLLNRGVNLGDMDKMVLRTDGLNELIPVYTKGFKALNERAELIQNLVSYGYRIDNIGKYDIIKQKSRQINPVNKTLNPLTSEDYDVAWK